MNCTNCGQSLRIAPEQVGVDEKQMPIYHRFAYCDKCMFKWDLDNISQPSMKSGDSVLSIIACVFAGLVFILLFFVRIPWIIAVAFYAVSVILALVDFGINDKTKSHAGSGVALLFVILGAIIAYM